MSRAKKFIQDCTRNCSNQYDFPEYFENGIKRLKEYQPWLTPDQARKAVEIAREEMLEKGIEFLKDLLLGYDFFGSDIERSVESFKQAMKYD